MISGEKLEIAVLNQISRAVLREKNIPELFREVLNILHGEMGFMRGTLTFRRGNYLYIEASHGLSEVEIQRGKYRLGEGITGKVAQAATGEIIPDISKSSGFLDRTKSRKSEKDIAFVCVPIIHSGEVIGTLSIDRKVTDPGTDLERDFNLLEIVANLLAEAVSSHQREEAELAELIDENFRLKRELELTPRPTEMIGNCQAMKMVYSMIARVADSLATVLILGNSGTGKELAARAIRQGGSRKDKPLVIVNCAALPENLIESELFGHEKGSFTGALTRRIGRVEAADGGTLFLDEIGDLSLPVQVKLLRFLQDKSFQRIGSNNLLHSDVRIIAATSRNLDKLMAEGAFREDLYYRLNVFPIRLPDLANRKADIMLLAEHFLDKYNKRHNRNVSRFSAPAVNMMTSYNWPGNVRELENCIERAILTSDGEVIGAANLPPSLHSSLAVLPMSGVLSGEIDFEDKVKAFERDLIVDALRKTRGNVSAAARLLQLTSRIIHYKIDKLNIEPTQYKSKL